MNDEREMILKMLQDGKISLEEADALLDVLNEPGAQEARGFAGAPQAEELPSADADADADSDSDSDSARDADADAAPRRDREFRRERTFRYGHRGFSFHGAEGEDMEFDLGGLKDLLRTTMGSVRETVEGVSDSLRDAFSGLGEADVAGAFSRAMGKVRAADERSLSAETGAQGSLRVANSWGDVRVTGVEATAITARAKITCWAADEELASASLEQTRVSLEEQAGEWVFSAELGSVRGTRIDVDLLVPRDFAVTVSGASGDLWLEDLRGSQTVNTMSGDVNIASLGAGPESRHRASTKSGDIIAAELSGEIALNTLSGDVAVNGFTGVLRVSTKSGDIRVTDGRGSVELRAVSGDIKADLLELGSQPVKLTSVSGDTRLEIPADAAVTIDARSASGEARVGVDLEEASRSEHRLCGTANGGGLEVSLSSVSGDVTVTGG